MTNTLLPGDYIIVSNAAYKLATPRSIPLIGFSIPSVTLLNFSKPEVNDVVVIAFPSNYFLGKYSNTTIVKRIVAGPGDTLQILNRKIFVNRKRLLLPSTVKMDYSNIIPPGKEGKGIFPKGSGWNADNYGPVSIPAKGDVIDLKVSTINQWKRLIVDELGEKAVRVEGSVITIKDKPAREYIVQQNHYFVMGDNYENSLDSRYLGFVAEDMILGKAMFIYWSVDPQKARDVLGFFKNARTDRIFKSIR